MFRFAYPWVLIALLLIPLLFLWQRRSPKEAVFLFSWAGPLKRFSQEKKWHPFFWLPSLAIYTALSLMIVGLARPQKVWEESDVLSEGIDIILAIDASGSMDALDFRLQGEAVNRLTVVKKVVQDFIAQQQGNRIGMVIFGDHAYTQSPTTIDYPVLIDLLEHIWVGIAGDGTAIGDGLALSVKRLQEATGKSKVIILLTDGRNNSGRLSPEKAAELAKTFGIKVYTIGIGTQGMVPIQVKGPFGAQIIQAKLEMDLETLKKIAELTDGKYFYAADTEKLNAIYQEISRLEKTKIQVKQYQRLSELYPYLTKLTLFLLFLELFLGATWLRRAC